VKREDSMLEKLVKDLDEQSLAELHRSAAAEMESRRRGAGMRLEDIRPGMSAEDIARARAEIAAILRGEE
jgi:hypothetical protein